MKILALAALALCACAPPPLPDYGALPGFSLVAQDGAAFGSRQLAGSPWIADFIYTSCPGPCPALTARLASMQKALPAPVRLVSFTVDPERDTPRVLKDYAARFGADPARWRFLTGKRSELRALARDGFKVPVTDAGGGLVGHTLKVALVDPALRVRGYYDGDDAASMGRLERDAAALAAAR